MTVYMLEKIIMLSFKLTGKSPSIPSSYTHLNSLSHIFLSYLNACHRKSKEILLWNMQQQNKLTDLFIFRTTDTHGGNL